MSCFSLRMALMQLRINVNLYKLTQVQWWHLQDYKLRPFFSESNLLDLALSQQIFLNSQMREPTLHFGGSFTMLPDIWRWPL